MLINKIHSFIEFLKNQEQSRFVTHAQIDDAIHRASVDLFTEYLPEFEKNSNITAAMQPFKVNIEIDSPFDFPENYEKCTGLETVVDGNYYSADELTDSEWLKRKKNPLIGPETEHPIFRIYSNKLEVLPEVEKVKIYYLKTPTPPKYVFTSSGRGEVFDPIGSVDIEWSEIAHNNIISKTLSYLGIPMKDELLIQMEQIKAEKPV